MTIDIPQLFISCDKNFDILFSTLKKINIKNVKEIHLANVKLINNKTYVAKKLNDGVINIEKLLPYFAEIDYITLKILGGISVFESKKRKNNKSFLFSKFRFLKISVKLKS